MAEIGGFAQAFAGALAEVAPVLDERARRLLMGAAARQLGRGGITLIAAATGASKDTVGRGAGELEAGVVVDGRIRATGAARPASCRARRGCLGRLAAKIRALPTPSPLDSRSPVPKDK